MEAVNVDYQRLSQLEIGGDKRIYQHLSGSNRQARAHGLKQVDGNCYFGFYGPASRNPRLVLPFCDCLKKFLVHVDQTRTAGDGGVRNRAVFLD